MKLIQFQYQDTLKGLIDVIEKILRGAQVNRFAVDKRAKVKTVINMLSADKLNEMEVYDKDTQVDLVKQKRLSKIMETADIYSEIGQYLNIS